MQYPVRRLNSITSLYLRIFRVVKSDDISDFLHLARKYDFVSKNFHKTGVQLPDVFSCRNGISSNSALMYLSDQIHEQAFHSPQLGDNRTALFLDEAGAVVTGGYGQLELFYLCRVVCNHLLGRNCL